MDLKSLVRGRDQAMEEIRRLQEVHATLEVSIVKELIGTKRSKMNLFYKSQSE